MKFTSSWLVHLSLVLLPLAGARCADISQDECASSDAFANDDFPRGPPAVVPTSLIPPAFATGEYLEIPESVQAVVPAAPPPPTSKFFEYVVTDAVSKTSPTVSAATTLTAYGSAGRLHALPAALLKRQAAPANPTTPPVTVAVTTSSTTSVTPTTITVSWKTRTSGDTVPFITSVTTLSACETNQVPITYAPHCTSWLLCPPGPVSGSPVMATGSYLVSQTPISSSICYCVYDNTASSTVISSPMCPTVQPPAPKGTSVTWTVTYTPPGATKADKYTDTTGALLFCTFSQIPITKSEECSMLPCPRSALKGTSGGVVLTDDYQSSTSVMRRGTWTWDFKPTTGTACHCDYYLNHYDTSAMHHSLMCPITPSTAKSTPVIFTTSVLDACGTNTNYASEAACAKLICNTSMDFGIMITPTWDAKKTKCYCTWFNNLTTGIKTVCPGPSQVTMS